jgi:hypothetical protein
MKQVLRLGKWLLAFIMAGLVSTQSFGQDERAQVAAFNREADWKLIRDTHLDIMDRLIKAPEDLNKVSFSDEARFLSLIQLTQAQYLEKVDLVRAAAKRLISKYGFTGPCEPCVRVDPTDRFREIVARYKKDLSRYNRYKTELTGLSLADGPSWCCGLRFYLCCTVCAATIAAFPAYLACCALCFDTYCCKP